MLDDSLEVLSYYDATFHHLYEIDPVELLERRDIQKMQLARYARQDLHKWDDIPVNEIRRWYFILKKVLDMEQELQTMVEET